MSASGPSKMFWEERFESQCTPWDRGESNASLERALAQDLLPVGARVLVTGCGAGHEVVRLAAEGLQVIGVDYAPAAVAMTRSRLAEKELQAEVVEADLLTWAPTARLDAVWDQACLCALHPDLWVAYAGRLVSWLEPGGRLFLLAMQAERKGRREGRIEGPPYHCDINAMRALFPSNLWEWPRPPYHSEPHATGFSELEIALRRRPGRRLERE